MRYPYSKHIHCISLVISVLLICAGCFQCTCSNIYLGLALIFFGTLFVFYTGCALLRLKFPKLVKCARLLATCIIILGCTYFCIVEAFVLKDAWAEPDHEADYVIVLGANVYGRDPSPALIDRLECAYKYLIAYPECVAVLTGGNETNQELTEAECMFQWLSNTGISENRLILEPRATSTEENIYYSFEIINTLCDTDQAVIGVISSDYHLHRAKYLASALGLNVMGIPARTSTVSTALNNYIREVFGMTYYYVFGVEEK